MLLEDEIKQSSDIISVHKNVLEFCYENGFSVFIFLMG